MSNPDSHEILMKTKAIGSLVFHEVLIGSDHAYQPTADLKKHQKNAFEKKQVGRSHFIKDLTI